MLLLLHKTLKGCRNIQDLALIRAVLIDCETIFWVLITLIVILLKLKFNFPLAKKKNDSENKKKKMF